MSLIFDRVSMRYCGGRSTAALSDLALELRPGETSCLLGPNGAGKSTALALAAGLLDASAGEVRWSGQPVTPLSPAPRFGYLPQHSAFPRTLEVREVLELAVAARGSSSRERDRVLAVAGLGSVLEERIGALSTGWVRRLGLGLALLGPTDLLLLDEPFVGLDLATLERSLALLRTRVGEGTVVVLSSHDFETVDALAPRLVVLDEGRLIGDEPPGSGSARDVYRRALAAGGGALMAAASGGLEDLRATDSTTGGRRAVSA